MKKISKINIPLEISVEEKHHIAMCGYHNNYADFSKGRIKGTVVFTGKLVAISIDHQFSFTIEVEQLITACLKERAILKRRNKKAGRK